MKDENPETLLPETPPVSTKKPPRAAKSKKSSSKKAAKPKSTRGSTAKYPRHSLSRVLRIPRGILDQNAGRSTSEKEAAGFAGLSYGGEFRLEMSSAIKFGLIERPEPRRVTVTHLAKKILRPQSPQDEIEGLRDAVLQAPDISEVYKHYRGENLPDQEFFANALTENFKIPADKVAEFTEIFVDTLRSASLLEEHGGKLRVVDVTGQERFAGASQEAIKRLGRQVDVSVGDTCFVMMPFSKPHGDYYDKIYDPAIRKAGLTPIRADNDIFGTGKIMDQIWGGIRQARVLVAELTSRNPNVFYELGLAHALQKPVVLVSSNEGDVPFDLQHIRVIYYDVFDPFWGEKLIAKISENMLSALKNPEDTLFSQALSASGG